jgi:hypothetical protein
VPILEQSSICGKEAPCIPFQLDGNGRLHSTMQVYGRIMNRTCVLPMQWTKQACAPNHTIHLFRFTTPKLLLVKSIHVVHSPVQRYRDMESTSYYPEKKLLQPKPLSVSGYEQFILLKRFQLQKKRALKQ